MAKNAKQTENNHCIIDNLQSYKTATLKRMVELATAGFGLVAALAWNELIRGIVDTYIKPQLGLGSGVISQAIYAVVITALAVFVTIQLSRLARESEEQNHKTRK